MENANLNQAVLNVMSEVTYINNDKTIGFGNNSYKTVSGEKLKRILQPILVKNGLTIRQTGVNYTHETREWEEGGKIKREFVFIAVVDYEISHISGEKETAVSFGQGINNGDKAPNIALSMSLRNLLLNYFMIPHGEEADNVGEPEEPQAPQKPVIEEGNEKWNGALKALKSGKTTIEFITQNYQISAATLLKLQAEINNA